MGEFFLDAEKVRIDFPDSNWIDVKQELTQEDSDYILNQMARAEARSGKSTIVINLGKLALLERSVLAWSFSEPINRENLSRLKVRYRIKLLEEINRLNEEAGEFVLKNA